MHRHQHLIKYLFNRELSEMYVSIALRNLALSMAGIFVPIYLFVDLKYPFSIVMIFFLIYSLSMLFSVLLAAKFTSKYGIKHAILLSMFGFIVYIIFLATLHYHNLYIIPAIISGISNSFYWIGFHTDFSRFSNKRNRGQQVSIWFITGLLGLLFGPIIGSIIITYLGFITLFAVVILVFLLSALPLFLSSEIYEPVKFSFKYIFKKSHLKDSYIFFMYGFRMIIAGVALPLYIFILLNKYISLGAIASLASLGSIFVGFFVGRLSKNEKREKTMFKYGSIFHSLGWFFLLFIKTFLQIAIINIYLAMSFIFVEIPHHTIVYTKARKKRNIMEYIVFREIVMNFGRIVAMLILLITGSLIISFILSGLGMLSWFFL